MASTFVDARFAGGSIVVSGTEFVGQQVVRLEIPGANPVPLSADEARALAHELQAYAAAADKRNARRADQSTTGEDQNTHEKDQS
jgi:hypothetical protein